MYELDFASLFCFTRTVLKRCLSSERTEQDVFVLLFTREQTFFFSFKKNKKKEAAEYNREKFLNVKPSGAEALCSSAVLLQGEKVGCSTHPKGRELIWDRLKLSLNGGVVKTLCVCVCVCKCDLSVFEE